jgi:hypothetical protein
MPMPMWITWINPKTQKRERIYNYCEQDDPAGSRAIRVCTKALSEKFRIPAQDIPGFAVEPAPWITIPLFREVDTALRNNSN